MKSPSREPTNKYVFNLMEFREGKLDVVIYKDCYYRSHGQDKLFRELPLNTQRANYYAIVRNYTIAEGLCKVLNELKSN